MTAAHDYEDMHHLVDRLPPAQVRRLRLLVESDGDLSRFMEPSVEDEQAPSPRPRLLSLIGIMDSGRGDLSERHAEILREELNRSE